MREELSRFQRGSNIIEVTGFNASTEFSINEFIYIHGLPYKISSPPTSSQIIVGTFIPFSGQNIPVQKGKTGIAFFDSARVPTYSYDVDRGDMRLGTYAATDEDSSRIEARTISRTTANGTYDSNMLLLENRSFVVNTFTNSGEQSVAKLSAYRNSFTDGSPEDEGTLAFKKFWN